MSALSPEVSALAARVELLEVVTTGALARRTSGEPVPPPGEQVDLELGLRVGTLREPAGFVVVAAVSVKARRRGATRSYARFVHRYNVRYGAPADVPEAVLAEFAQTNGMLHLWPYARAAVQQGAAMMGLPPIVLPVFRGQAPRG